MELFLVQHAESRTKEEDPDKSLTEYGVTAALQIASWAAKAEIQVDEIRHSGDPEREVVAFENAGIVCLQRAGGEWSLHWAMVPRLLNTG